MERQIEKAHEQLDRLDLDKLQKYAQDMQELARQLRVAENARAAAKISRQIRDVSKNMEIATRAQEQIDEYERNLRKATG